MHGRKPDGRPGVRLEDHSGHERKDWEACDFNFNRSSMGVQRIRHHPGSVVTPYEDWLNEKLRIFLTTNGLEVVALKSMPLREGEPMNMVAPEIVYRYSRDTDRPEAQAIFKPYGSPG